MSKVEDFGQEGLEPPDTWPIKGLRRYLQVILIFVRLTMGRNTYVNDIDVNDIDDADDHLTMVHERTQVLFAGELSTIMTILIMFYHDRKMIMTKKMIMAKRMIMTEKMIMTKK